MKILNQNKSENKFAKEILLPEINQDINTIKQFKTKNPFYPSIPPQKENNLFYMFENIKEKYSKNYCPSPQFPLFNQANKIQYAFLRAQIDNLLEIKNILYKI